jgi:hypothetical protein
MHMQRAKYVQDLKAWNLPRLEDLEEQVEAEFAGRARLIFLERGEPPDQLHRLFLDRLREMAGVAVNETIEYWVKGLADGNNGQCPELCVELPYLERGENTDALTLAYRVDNEDGTRTELNRVSLERVMERLLEGEVGTSSQLRVIAAELRALAEKVERVAVSSHA